MAERMTSRAEANEMKSAITACIDDLERRGFSRSQIGACMAGVSVGVVAAHEGLGEANRVLEAVSDAIHAQMVRQ